MAIFKLLVFSGFFALMSTIPKSHSLLRDDVSSATKVSDSSLRIELEQLKSRISILEISMSERNGELQQKEESIRKMEKIIQEKSESIVSLQSEIESLQLQKVSDGQTTTIHKHKRALQEAEVHGGWLSHWISVVDHFQLYIVTQWKDYGRPITKEATDKALKMIDEAEEWIDLTTETIKTEWIPNLRKWWYIFNAHLESFCQLLAEKIIHVFNVSKSYIEPNIEKALKVAHPYIQEATRLGELQIHQLAILAKPHIDKVHATSKPYIEEVLLVYRKFITTSTSCHGQVQELLKNNDLTRPYATMELAWFVATALLALPAIFLFKLHETFFRKKVKKRMRNSNVNHMHRRPKRAHSD